MILIDFSSSSIWQIYSYTFAAKTSATKMFLLYANSIMITMGIHTLTRSGLLHWFSQLVNLNSDNRLVMVFSLSFFCCHSFISWMLFVFYLKCWRKVMAIENHYPHHLYLYHIHARRLLNIQRPINMIIFQIISNL